MKTRIFELLFIFLISCNSNKVDNGRIITLKDTLTIHDTVYVDRNSLANWQEYFGLTHIPDKDTIWFKQVSYYLDDSQCSGLARDFYYGSLRPSDDGTTDELLKLATTDNNKLRPFYRWCLNMTIVVQDGGLAEHTGVPARKYAEKFPKEFFEYMDSDTSKQKYNNWASSIGYSGYYNWDDYKRPNNIIIKRLTMIMKSNCKGCNEKMLRRIDTFAKDCFR